MERRLFLILLALTAIIMVGCDYQNSDGSYSTYKGYLKTVVMDSCEYVKGYNRLAHKGNCKYCQERMRKMIKEVKNEWMDNNKSMGHR